MIATDIVEVETRINDLLENYGFEIETISTNLINFKHTSEDELRVWAKRVREIEPEEPVEISPVVTRMIKEVKHDMRNMGYSDNEIDQFLRVVKLEED